MELTIALKGKNLAEQLGISTERGQHLAAASADCYTNGKNLATILQGIASICVPEEELVFCGYIIGALDSTLEPNLS